MLISCRTATAAPEGQVMTEVQTLLGRRAEMKHPPASLAVSDSVALGIALMYTSSSQTGRVLERFVRNGSADSKELVAAGEFEQGYASPEGYAALYCFILWVRGQVHRRGGE